MPSFAKSAQNGNAKDTSLESVWKEHPTGAIVQQLLAESRTRAALTLRETIPAKMAALRELLKQQDDPSSVLWSGHATRGEYVMPRIAHSPAGAGAIATAAVDKGQDPEKKGRSPEGRDSNPAKLKLYSPEDIAVVFAQTSLRDTAAGADVGDDASDASVHEGDRDLQANADAQRKIRLGMHWFETVPLNKVQSELIVLALKEFEELYDIAIDLKLWLEMEVPVIEDGNSFGAEVQQHLITQLENVLKKAISWQNGTRQHHADRYKLAAEWAKYPNIQDIPAAIAGSDRFDHYLVRSYLRQLLICYAGLMTKFERNWEKVINPKGKEGGSIGGMY